MNTRDVHRHIEDLHKITWFRVVAPTHDHGGEVHAFVQADTEEAAIAILDEHEGFPDLDTGEGIASTAGSSWTDVEKRMGRATWPDVALGQDGDVIHPGDL